MPRRVKFEDDERWKDNGPEGRGFKTNDEDEAIRMVEEFKREGAFNPNKYRSKRRTKRRSNRIVNFSPEIITRNDKRSTRSSRRSTRRSTRSPGRYYSPPSGDPADEYYTGSRPERVSSLRRSTKFQPRLHRRNPHTRRRNSHTHRRNPHTHRRNPHTHRRNPHTHRRNPHTRRRNPHTHRRNPHTRRRNSEFIQRSPNKKRSSGRYTQPTQKIITMDMKRSLKPDDLVPYFVDFILGISVMEVDELPGEKLSYLDLVMKFKNRYKGKRENHDWENMHASIQWIFPTNTESEHAPDTSPILPRSNRDFISQYGHDVFEKIAFTIEYASKFYYDYVIKYKFLEERDDHNFKRIARVANCLKYFNKNETAKRFLRSIISKSKDKNRVNQKSFKIWSDILKSL